MSKLGVILIIGTVSLLISTTFILASPLEKTTMEVRKEHATIEHEGTQHEREIRKKERQKIMKAKRMLRMRMLLMYIDAQRGGGANQQSHPLAWP